MWDGRFEDEQMMNGVYVYTIQIETRSGDPIQAHGEILILR